MILKRIEEFILHKKVSFNKFEDAVNVSRGGISGAIRKGRNIGSNVVENILHKYPDLSSEWLLRGEGNMLKSENKSFNTSSEDYTSSLDNSIIKQVISYLGLHSKVDLVELLQQFNENNNMGEETRTRLRVERLENLMANYILELGELKEWKEHIEKKTVSK
ncbi:hypothetical protein [Spongiimicrobium salis]|uniref:hypothetical protein n=1 Tax=Spongiimicrobium salis TaxID=1667022 RepID=UPI00374CF6C1